MSNLSPYLSAWVQWCSLPKNGVEVEKDKYNTSKTQDYKKKTFLRLKTKIFVKKMIEEWSNMAQNDHQWLKMGQHLEIFVPKCYTKIVTNFKAFLEVKNTRQEVEVQQKKQKYKTGCQKRPIFSCEGLLEYAKHC